ncbi:putative CXXCH cytochrome family protein [Haloferula luteola]|uniref:Putative CXXCH cytochrome family protein n=1 Tax=Haloferula luteola TaxID=595692 RepID=A0A840VKU7_9BACT|nr:ammonia-forming cytochrome c nitrite reductase subunit c552 [Haloferula luteola]MBB5353281.1 putative CXXCH cytochrome family protein [Haloferula luteola]
MRDRAGILALLLLLGGCEKTPPTTPAQSSATSPPAPQDPSQLTPSSQCLECHREAHESWQHSHHALAHRNTGNPVDAEAFAGTTLQDGPAQWTFAGGAAQPEIRWEDDRAGDLSPKSGSPPMAIGTTPLVQYLLAAGDGRYQVPDMAWDPAKKEWFSIYGEEHRHPDEWGHWTQRGMNWNAQCAYCHFTGLRKDYDPETDHYATRWVEQGVGCAQCHGGKPEVPNADGCLIDRSSSFSKAQWTESCATCHARREEFDETFTTGRSFHDHYGLALPNQPGLWFPDGQQLDEIYKYTSLLLSRMGHKGIGCTDCHDPHAATPKFGDAAVRANALCMTCHASGQDGAVIIDVTSHTHHPPGVGGSSCVDCHMPKRSYMGRDPRSDHRFPRPDPLLTKELGVPNACNDCHSDQTLEWQIEKTHEWYGETMNAVGRKRTRAIDAAQNGRPGALAQLLDAFSSEEMDAWQATLLRLMEPWAQDSRVVRSANVSLHEGGPLVRAAAAALIARRGETGPLLETALADPLKAVRLEAAWGAFEHLPAQHPAIQEAEAVARHQSDQPAGAMRMARIAIARGNLDVAEQWMKKAAEWDRTSPVPRRDLAIFLNSQGRSPEALEWMQKAVDAAPENPEFHYLYALSLAENQRPADAEKHFQEAVRLAPRYSRAWYNLGLLQAGQNRVDEALQSLRHAEQTDPSSPDAPYARATLHLRLQQWPQAQDAAAEALRRAPDHAPSAQLLRDLQQRR